MLAAMRALAILLLLAACGDPPTANLCPGTTQPKCLTRTICALDQSRGCEVCQCEPAMSQPPGAPTTPQDPTIPP